ncbi:hypothetical protein [Prevotella pallens]|uniref:hypothetical protein n=1 Tax=Prevotella pallens TaxID=60133 RepID=UPI003C7CE694
MAEGNLGDLMFSLGVKDNVSKDLENIMKKFINTEASVNKTSDALHKLSSKLRNVKDDNENGPTRGMLKLADAIEGSVTRITRLRSEIRKTSDAINNIKSIPNFMQDKNLLTSLNKLQGYLKTLNSIDGVKILDGNRLQAVFANGTRSIQEANAALKAYKGATKQAEMATEGNARAVRDLASSFRQANEAASKTSGLMSDMKSLLLQGGIVYGAQQFANSIIQTGGEIAQQHIALRNIIGDARKADELFAQTQQLALESPFKFGELNRDVKQLAAFGVETDSLYDTTKRLADVASGLGVSFERLGLAYGQVKSRSWLDGKELRQFAYAGLPLLQKITDLYNQTGKDGRNNYTTKDVRDMITKRQVSFEDVDAVIKKLTDEGGQFYNMQYVLSDTLLGRWNKLIDAWDIMLGKFADGKSMVGRFFMTAINGAVTLVQSIDRLGPVLLAAFSGVALKRLSSSIGGGLAGSLLSSKQSLAAKFQEKALIGELNAEEQRILSTKNQITARDLETLATTKAITMADLQRAYVARQITTEQYKNISALLMQQRQTVTLATRFRFLRMQVHQIFTANYWQNFAARGVVALNLIKTGAVSLGRTIWTAIGGLPGLLITGASMLFANLVSEKEELKQAADSIAENTKQVYDDLQKYIDENPINVKASISDIAEQINKEKDILKEKAGSGYDSIIVDVGVKSNGDIGKQLEYLRKYTDLYARAAEKAQAMKNVFVDAEKASKGVFRESIQTNLADLEKSAQKLSLTTSKISMAQLVRDAQDLKSKSDVSGDFKKFADIILEANKNGLTLYQTLSNVKDAALNMPSVSFRGSYGTSISDFVGSALDANKDSKNLDANIADFAKSLSGQFENLAKSPTEQALYHILKDSWKSANNLDVVQGAYFDMKLDQAMGLKEFPSLAEDMAKDAAGRISDTTRQLIASGQPLTKAAQEDVRRATNAAMDHFKATWPGNAAKLQEMIGNYKFQLNVRMHVIGDQSVTQNALDDFYQGKPNVIPNLIGVQGQRPRQFSQNGGAYYKQWTNGESLPDEVEKKGRESVDKALETYTSAARQRGKAASAAYLTTLINVRAAFKEVFGYNYNGTPSGITNKDNRRAEQARKKAEKAQRAAERAKRKREAAAERARRKWEKEQRQILKGWQNRKRLLEEYYETWNKWRKIEGSENAKTRLRSDKRFGKVNKDFTDPEDLAGNLSNLVEGYKKLAKIEDQRNFIAETRAEASKKEADIEYQNAEKQVKVLTEQLDLLSKQYDIYKNLSKYTSNSIAAEYAFDFEGAGYASKGSYYGFLRDSLNRMQGKKATPKPFIDNSVPNAKENGMVLDEVTVTADTKKVDFGSDGLEGVLKLTDTQIEEIYGKESKLTKELIEFKKQRAEIDSEIAENLSQSYEFEEDYGAQIEFNNKRLDEQIERLRERNRLGKLSDEGLAEAELELRKRNTRNNNELSFKQMQKETGWASAMGNLGVMSSGVLKRLRAEIETRLDKGNLSDDERSKLNEALNKLNEQFEKSDPFASIVKGYNTIKAIETIRQGKKDESGRYTVDAKKAIAAGLQVNKDGKYSEAELDLAQGNVFKGFDTSIKAIADGFQSLQTVLQPVVDLFEALGNKGIGEGAQIAGKAVNSGMNVAGGIKNLQNLIGPDTGLGQALGKAGPYAAAAAAAISVFSSLWNRKTASQKAYEKQAEYLKNIQGTVKEINSNLKEKVSSAYGSQAQVSGTQIKRNLETEAQEVRNTYYLWSNAKKHRGGHRNRVKVFGLADEINSWLESIGWDHRGKNGEYISKVGSQEIQLLSGELLARFREEHAGVWANIDSSAKEYLNRLIEIENKEGEIAKITEEMAKSLTDMDLSTLKSEWTNLLNDLDSANEDFADNFEKHMRNAILSGMIANLYGDKLAELNKENAKRGGNEKGNKYIAKDGSVKEHTGGDDSKDVMSEYTEEEYRLSAEAYKELSEQTRQTRDVLKKLYGWSDKDSKSRAGSNIKGITEETADILASYVNQCRADLSVVRNLQATHLPQLSEVAKSQLTQLSMISQHTLRNAEAAERIDVSVTELSSNIRQVINGTKQIHVK